MVMNRVRQLVAAAVFCVLAAPSVAYAQKLVYVVRHAERADGGASNAPMTGAPADPSLSAAGEARAAKLAAMLSSAGIAAIYATELKRTQETAKPLSSKTHVPVTTIKSADTPRLISDLRTHHAADVVLIVAHSNTIPDIIKALGGPAVTVADSEYDNLFVIVPASGTISKIKF
jgi:broad specificity phosphatase PhoE